MEKTGKDSDTKKTPASKKRNIEIIKQYISSQPEKIKKLENFSSDIIEMYTEFKSLTKNYSDEIVSLATKLKPESNSTEGQLVQSIQNLLLFYSDSLNTFVNTIQKEVNKQYNRKESVMLNSLDDLRKIYNDSLKKLTISQENYKKESESYQELLVSMEYLDYQKSSKEKKFLKIQTLNNKDYIPVNEKDLLDIDYSQNEVLNMKDNEKEVIEAQKNYLQNVNDSNNKLKKILEYLIAEKTDLRQTIYNNCVNFIEAILTCVKNQYNTFETQKNNILNLANSLKEQKDSIEEHCLRPIPCKLEFLDIYYKFKHINDGFENMIKKSLNDDDEKNQNNNTNRVRKSISDMEILSNFSREYIENYNNYNNKRKVLKTMISKLNRINILNIVDKLKEIKFLFSEEDKNKINVEKNIKKLKDILRILFYEPENFTEDNKNEVIKFLSTNKGYINYFLKILNNHRTRAHCIITEQTMSYLGSIFKFLNDLIISENDIKCFKNVLILAMTYYYITKNEKEETKHYLFSYISEHPCYKKIEFWEAYLAELIKYDLDSNVYVKNKIINTKENEIKENTEKISNCTFSNILTVTKNMSLLKITKSFVKSFVESAKGKFTLTEQQIENVYLILETYDYVTEDGEEKVKESEDKETEKNSETQK